MKPPEFFGRFFNHGIARKIRLFPVGSQHGYLMATFPQKADEIHGGQGGRCLASGREGE